MSSIKRVDRRHHHTLMDRTLPPAITVVPGELVAMESLDACYGLVRSLEDFERYRNDPQRRTDPLTGPVYVTGANPGDTLVVEVIRIELDEVGFQLIGPQRAIIRDEVSEWDHYSVRVCNGQIRLPRGLVLPVDPVIGTLGNAPAGEATNRPNRLGGNLDCPQIRTGVRVYLPIQVQGALFFLGDIHARQGDGEIIGAPEIGGIVTLRFQVQSQKFAEWPVIEDATHWHIVAAAPAEEDAIRIATLEMAEFVRKEYGLSQNDAFILLTMCISLRCSRTGGHGELERVICASVSKSLLDQATKQYRDVP